MKTVFNTVEINAAVFVDFDNIFSLLMEEGRDAALGFAEKPYFWMKWLRTVAIRNVYGKIIGDIGNSDYDERNLPIQRTFSSKMCYINTGEYKDYARNFSSAGFRIFDCPSVTQRGKTSSDMYLAIDCADLVHSCPDLDEVFILSSDVDFAPLVHYMHKFGKKSYTLSVGRVSSVYSNIATWQVRQDWFISECKKIHAIGAANAVRREEYYGDEEDEDDQEDE